MVYRFLLVIYLVLLYFIIYLDANKSLSCFYCSSIFENQSNEDWLLCVKCSQIRICAKCVIDDDEDDFLEFICENCKSALDYQKQINI